MENNILNSHNYDHSSSNPDSISIQSENIQQKRNSQQIVQKQNKKDKGTGQQFDSEKSLNKVKKNQKRIQRSNGRSIFHNFQKHLVLTLKSVIKIKQYKNPDKIKQISYNIWRTFKQCKNSNKQILHVLFGVANDYLEHDNHLSKSNLLKFGFLSIYQRFQLIDIENAQEYLRKQVAFQLRTKENLFQGRKIQKSQQFNKYIKKFIQQIQKGPIRKRMTKIQARQVKIQLQNTTLQ